MTILPSSIISPTTTTVGVFKTGSADFAEWLRMEFNKGLNTYSAISVSGSLEELIAKLKPLSIPTIDRYLIFEKDRTTFLLNNSKGGTDLGMIPSLCSRQLGVMAVRATSIDAGSEVYPANILEIFTPDGEEPLRSRRVISAANDGGHWEFDQHGEPFGFENISAYDHRNIKDRFTAPMLHRYLDCLGVPEIPSLDFNTDVAVLLTA